MSQGSGEAKTPPYALLAGVLAVGAFVVHALLTSGAIIDDAYVTFRYARNLVEGAGLVFNPGERAEGYTNFSWVILSSLVIRLGLDAAWVMPIVGTLCGAGVVVTTFIGARTPPLESSPSAWAGIPAATVVALSPSLAFYAGTGLETALYTLLLAASGVTLVRERGASFGALTGVAFLTRPEAAVLGAVGLGILALRRRHRAVLHAAGVMGAIVLPYLVFKMLYFGHVVPNTLLAKRPHLAFGGAYVLWALPEVAGLAVLATLGASASPPRATLLTLWATAMVGAALEGGDFMPGQRMLVPALPWLAMAADAPFRSCVARPRRLRDAWRTVLLAVAVAYVPLALLDAPLLRGEAQYRAAYDPKRAEVAHVMWDGGVRSIGTLDIGLISYVEPRMRILDLGGLTDRTIALTPGPHTDKDIAPAYLASKAPDAFLVTSRVPAVAGPDGTVYAAGHYGTERRIMRLPWFRDHYRLKESFAATPDYYLVWFARANGAVE